MRTRFAVLAVILGALTAAVVGPGVAGAAPHHNRGLTINATPNPIIAGSGVLIYGQLDGTDNANQTIYLYHRVNPRQRFSLIQVGRTNSVGFYEFTRAENVVMTNRSWFVRGPGGTHSRTIHERVAANVTLAPNASTATTGQQVLFTGSVSPNHPYQRVKLQVQNALAGNGWETIATAFTGAGSMFTIPHHFARPGDYTLRAVFPGDVRNITGASDAVTVTVQQKQNPTFTINSTPSIIQNGQSVNITGVLYQPNSTTAPEQATEVTLYGHQDNQAFQALQTVATGTDGSYSFTQMPIHNEVYRVETTLKPHRFTALLYEGVQDMLTISSSSNSTTVGGTVTLSGSVTPDHTGHVIYLQQQDAAGNWHNVESGVVGNGSMYSFKYTPGKQGTANLRARIYGGPENIGNASPTDAITVSGVAPVASLPPAS